MNLNTEIKESKKEVINWMLSEFIKGKFNKTSGIVGGGLLLILEMMDVYTTTYPVEIQSESKTDKVRRKRNTGLPRLNYLKPIGFLS